MARLNERQLLERAQKMLPKGIPAEAIESVEVDRYGNSDAPDGISYWVYLRPGFVTERGAGCHTAHEDNLKNLAGELSGVIYRPDDTDGYGDPLDDFPVGCITVAEMLAKDINIDVYDNVCESLTINFWGPMTLTQEGMKEFHDALSLWVKIYDSGDYPMASVNVDGPEGVWQKKLKAAKHLFNSAAGYCACDDYDKWFEKEDA